MVPPEGAGNQAGSPDEMVRIPPLVPAASGIQLVPLLLYRSAPADGVGKALLGSQAGAAAPFAVSTLPVVPAARAAQSVPL